jgi:hypothetical protein
MFKEKKLTIGTLPFGTLFILKVILGHFLAGNLNLSPSWKSNLITFHSNCTVLASVAELALGNKSARVQNCCL